MEKCEKCGAQKTDFVTIRNFCSFDCYVDKIKEEILLDMKLVNLL